MKFLHADDFQVVNVLSLTRGWHPESIQALQSLLEIVKRRRCEDITKHKSVHRKSARSEKEGE